jgi:hypothetical protein
MVENVSEQYASSIFRTPFYAYSPKREVDISNTVYCLVEEN